MLTQRKEKLFFLLLLTLAILSGWYSYSNYHANKKQTLLGHHPDIIADGIVLDRYDANGKLATIITSDVANHYPDDKTTDFTQADMLILSKDADHTPWHIYSNNARMWGQGDKIFLYPQVNMEQTASKTQPSTKVITSNVTIFTDKKFLSTDDPLHAEQPNLQVDAVGATYDSNKSLLHLLSKVQVNYLPEKKSK